MRNQTNFRLVPVSIALQITFIYYIVKVRTYILNYRGEYLEKSFLRLFVSVEVYRKMEFNAECE